MNISRELDLNKHEDYYYCYVSATKNVTWCSYSQFLHRDCVKTEQYDVMARSAKTTRFI